MRMRIYRLVVCLVLLFVAGFGPAGAVVEESAKGHYILRMEGLSRYGTDFIIITAVGTTGVSGEVGIDWGIGPQARTPQEWEKLYRMTFRAEKVHGGNAFRFTVEIAGRLRYEFTLFPTRDRQNRMVLVGTMTLKARNHAERFRDGTFGVLAETQANKE